MRYIFITALFLSSLSTMGQKLTLSGSGGYDISTNRFFWLNGSDSIARISIYGTKLFKPLKIGFAAVGSVSDSLLSWNTTDSSVRKIAPLSSFLIDSTGYHTVTATTTDNTPTSVVEISVPDGYTVSVEATCVAITADGNSGYNAVLQRAFSRNASSALTTGGVHYIGTDDYLGGTLSSAAFFIGDLGSSTPGIRVTGESATTIHWKIRYKVVSINVSF